MMTPEKAPANNEASFVEDAPSTPNDVSLDAYNDEDVVDIENQQNDSNAASSANINNTVNDSMTSENCKIINESDQQHTPCPDPEGANTQDMEDVMLIPDSPNLTPVKLDAELKENVTFMSSPTNSQDVRQDDEEETRPLSRRQQRMRVLKCYGLVAIVVLICAIGIPLGAVMIFKNKNEETTFSGITSDGNPTMPVEDTKPPVVLEETTKPVVTTETAVVAEEEDDDDDDDTTLPVQEEIDTEAPAVVVAEPWDVVTDAPVPVDTNVTDPLIEKNVTSEAAPVIDEEQETDSLPVIDEEEEATDAPLVVDEDKEEETDAPTEKEVVDTDAPTMGPTVSPTAKGTRAPGPDRSPIYFELVNVTSPAVLQDVSSPQALSYLWLVEQDETLPVPTGRKLLQRYVLVLMDHVLHDPVRPVLSQASLDECEWTGVVCDEDTGDVLEVNWGRQNMNGQLVPEMRHLDKLERLDLSENELVGSLDFLYETKSLREIYLNDNQFSGTLSEQIGLIGNLEKLYLGHNELTGQIPISLRSPVGEAKPLKWLVLSHNKFSGYLPPDWRMRNLFYLDLGYNYLSGPLPNDWESNLVRLRHLYLDHNSFTGTVPGYFSQLGNGRIKQINLNSNFLEGEVPFIWEPKDQLIALNFQDNNLTIPLDSGVCELSVFEQGVMVEMRVDCPICTCETLCHMCG